MYTLEALSSLYRQLGLYDDNTGEKYAKACKVPEIAAILDQPIGDLNVVVADCNTLRAAFESNSPLFNHYDKKDRFEDCVVSAIDAICEQEHIRVGVVLTDKSIAELRSKQ